MIMLEFSLITVFVTLSNSSSCLEYLVVTEESTEGFTDTTKLSKSMPAFGKINF